MSRATNPIAAASGTSRGFFVATLTLLVFVAVQALSVGGIVLRQTEGKLAEAALAIVSLPPPVDPARAMGDRAGVIAVLLSDPTVARVEPIPEAEVREALASSDRTDLAVPVMLEVHFATGVTPDLDRIDSLVRAIADDAIVEEAGTDGATVDRASRQILMDAAWVAAASALAMTVLVMVGMIAVLADRAREAVDLLDRLGADRAFVVRQFRQPILADVWVAGLAGSCLAALAALAALRWPEPLDWFGMAPLQPIDALTMAVASILVVALLLATAFLSPGWQLRRPR